MVEIIEKLKVEVHETAAQKRDWKPAYRQLMQEVFNQDLLFFALSLGNYDEQTHSSVPLLSTKDFGGQPALYVFTDVNTAGGWMSAYKNVSPDMQYGLIGAVSKEHNFLYVFETARAMGASMIMLDEGGKWIGLDMNTFFEVNGLSTSEVSMVMTQEEMQELTSDPTKSVSLHFARIPAIPLKKSN